jgi:hypothetical protein
MIIVQYDYGSNVLKFLRPRNLRKAVRVCNNLKISMVLVHPALQNLATRGPILFQKFVITRVHNCTVHGPRLKFLLTAFSGRSPGDFANLSCFLHPDICYSRTLPSNLIQL